MRLDEDCALMMRLAIMDIIVNILRPEEYADCAQEIYEVCLAGIQAFVIQRSREMQRLNPSQN